MLILEGFLHPLIHLGFGVEFQQPAIIAEALAQAAVHSGWIGRFLVDSEEEAARSTSESKSLVQLLDEIRSDQKLSTAAHWDDSNKVRDGIMVRAPEEMIKYASQFKVNEQELDLRTAEMVNAVGKCSKAEARLLQEADAVQYTIQEVLSIRRSRSSLTFTTCTV